MKRKLIVGLMVAVLATLLLGCGDEEVDVTPPVISDITVSNFIEGKTVYNSAEINVTITWTTDEPTKGYLKYRCPRDGDDGVSPIDGWDLKYTDESTFHRVVLEDLPCKLCWFHVIAHDASGNIATSEEMSVTTPAPPPHLIRPIGPIEGEGDC